MSFTIESPFGQECADSLEPWLTEDLERWLDAVGVIFDPVYTLAQETGTAGEPGWVPGYGVIFDVDECPLAWLPYLGQYIGVKVPVGALEEEARSLVKAESGKERGTLQAVESAIIRNLTGAKAFVLIERRNVEGEEDPDHFLIGVAESELPSQAALEEAVRAVKPGGVFFTVQVRDGWPFNEAEKTFAEDTMTFAETYSRRP